MVASERALRVPDDPTDLGQLDPLERSDGSNIDEVVDRATGLEPLDVMVQPDPPQDAERLREV